jgi:hypothetical protein
MIRICTMLALFELALLAALVGLPEAQADPTEDCCGQPRGEECSGCLGGYLLGPGDLHGCITTGVAMGCDLSPMECNGSDVPIIRWKDGTGCVIYQELSLRCSIYMPGCSPTECE